VRVLVFGAGGVGLYFSAVLAHAGHHVTVVGRSATATAAERYELQLTTTSGVLAVGGIQVVTDIAEVQTDPTIDLIIVAVKAWQVGAAATTLAPLVGAHTVVLPLQNGIEAADDLANVLGPQHVLGCSCVVIAKRTEPWAATCLGAHAHLEIGPISDSFAGELTSIAAALREARVSVTLSKDIRATLWRKFMLISSYGGVGVLSRQPVGVTSATPETAALIREAMTEVLAVGQAHGVALSYQDVESMMNVFNAFDPLTTSSMHRDLLAGRPSELEHQSGAVLRYGRAVGVPTPIHWCIYASQLPSETAAHKTTEPAP
jgi:2-dehydropantoate 2-reductase